MKPIFVLVGEYIRHTFIPPTRLKECYGLKRQDKCIFKKIGSVQDRRDIDYYIRRNESKWEFIILYPREDDNYKEILENKLNKWRQANNVNRN